MAGHGAVRAGQLWLAMELARKGSLAQRLHVVGEWSALRVVLLHVLSALAHAHAAGVVHRDLKPANVLLVADDRDVRVADFGLAWTGDADARRGRGGSPPYMAPEQFTGDPAALGPWSDLYALGCTAWHLATGSPPFPSTWEKARVARLRGERSVWSPRFPVPEGLRTWVEALLELDPFGRPPFAADATAALGQLPTEAGPTVGSGVRRLARGWQDTRTVPASASTWQDEPGTQRPDTAPSRPDPDDAPRAESPRPIPVAPLPELLPGLDEATRAVPLMEVEAGLGLFQHRRRAVLGRTRELSAAWSVLARAAATRTTAWIAFRGHADHGRADVADHLANAAHAAGVWVLRAQVTRGDAPAAGLARALRAWLGLAGGSAPRSDRLTRRLHAAGAPLAHWVVEDLAQWLSGGELRTAAAVEALRALAARRCTMLRTTRLASDPLLLDVARAAGLRGELTPGPFVVLDDDDTESAPPAGATRVDLEPLAAAVLAEQLSLRLPLAPGLAFRVAEGAVGNVERTSGWLDHAVATGALVPTPAGFDLDPARKRRVDEQTGVALEPGQRRALELAVVCDGLVEEGRWAAAIGPDAFRCVERLVDLVLVTRESDGYRTTAAAAAAVAGIDTDSSRDLHRAWARVWDAAPGSDEARWRTAWHLGEAGDAARAWSVLAELADRADARGDLRLLEAVLDAGSRALDRAAPDPGRRRSWELRKLRLAVALGRPIGAAEVEAAAATLPSDDVAGRLTVARLRAWAHPTPEGRVIGARAALDEAQAAGSPEHAVTAADHLALLQVELGDLAGAVATVRQGDLLARELPEQARARVNLDLRAADVAIALGDAEAALARARHALDAATAARHASCVPRAWFRVGLAHRMTADWAAAEEGLHAALDGYRRTGNGLGVAAALDALSQDPRESAVGALDLLEQADRWARAAGLRHGDPVQTYHRGLCCHRLSRWGDAREAAEQAQASIEATGGSRLLPAVYAVQLVAAAGGGDEAAVDTWLDRVGAAPASSDVASDVAELLTTAAALLDERGRSSAATRVRERIAPLSPMTSGVERGALDAGARDR